MTVAASPLQRGVGCGGAGGPQSGLMSWPGLLSIGALSPPLEPMTQMSRLVVPWTVPTIAMRSPAGDQAGLVKESAALWVRLTLPEPSAALIVQMFGGPASSRVSPWT